LQPNLSPTDLEGITLIYPPIPEQHEIVHRVENLFRLADSLEAKYKKAMAAVEKIEQAILAKAFRGELAAQDQSDEPASELLKRIKKEKEGARAKKTRTRA
jgi:type I restriction enzyme S subunit